MHKHYEVVGAFSDHFSGVAAGYSEFRPTYPEKLFDLLVNAVAEAHSKYESAPGACDTNALDVAKALVWDCAAGTGQASVPLAKRFGRVLATDASTKQLLRGERHSHVYYAAARAEQCPLPPNSASLVTVAQALHWFDVNAFYGEVKRVLRAGGVLAVWCYGLLRVDENKSVEHVIDHFSEVTVGPWWPPERKHIDAAYQDLPFPFERIVLAPTEMTAQWKREELLGYLRTWSAVSRKSAELGVDPVAEFEPVLKEAWGEAGTLTMRWPLTVLAGS